MLLNTTLGASETKNQAEEDPRLGFWCPLAQKRPQDAINDAF